MSHLNDQRVMATALFAAAREVVLEIEAEARARQAQRRTPAPEPKPVETTEIPDYFPSDSCTCMSSSRPPCSWCTSDDNPLNAEDVPA